MVALAIGTMLALMAVPGYARWLAEQRLMDEARRLCDTLALARAEAIKRNGRVTVCVAAGASCATAGGWHRGFIAFHDLDGNADFDPGEPVFAVERPAQRDTTVVGNGPVARYVSFTFTGHARRPDGALQMGTFTVCRPGLAALKVVLANSGRTRIDRSASPCP